MASTELSPDELPQRRHVNAARWLGIALQGLILGVMLFGATVVLLILQSGTRIFRYENF